MTDRKRPIKVFTAKGGIEAAIWPRNRGGNPPGSTYEVRISKSYRDRQGWHNTNRFDVDDLPKVAVVAEQAYRHLALREINPADKHNNTNGENPDEHT